MRFSVALQGNVSLGNDNLLAGRAEEEIDVISSKTSGLTVRDHVEIPVDWVGQVLDRGDVRGDNVAVCGLDRECLHRVIEVTNGDIPDGIGGLCDFLENRTVRVVFVHGQGIIDTRHYRLVEVGTGT